MHQFDAETRPITDFVIVGCALVMAKLNSVVSAPRLAVDFIVAVMVHGLANLSKGTRAHYSVHVAAKFLGIVILAAAG